MRPITRLLAVLLVYAVPSPATADIIHVPGDYPTIQLAIDAATDGDEIIVAPGTYNETVDFSGKAITLRSSDGPEVTTIDGTGLNDSVVKCISGEGASTTLDGFTITGGGNTITGGGMKNINSSPTVLHCRFIGNSASRGGGMANQGSNPWVNSCTFEANQSTAEGGGMDNFSSNPFVTNCIFRTNSSANVGGGMYNDNGTVPIVANCLFIGNTAVFGGGMRNGISAPTLINCTFIANVAEEGGAMYSSVENPTVTNCIMWNNKPDEIVDASGAETTVSNSDVQGGYEGGGNIDADPLFVQNPNPGPDGEWGTEDDDFGDLRLRPGSPCIDSADNSAVSPDETDLDDDGDTDEPIPLDLDGNPRFVDDPTTADCTQAPGQCGECPVVDMGAYEFQDGTKTCCPADLDGDGEVGPADLAELLGSWGPCEECPADLDLNGNVGPFDLALLLGTWGPCQ